MNRSAGTLESKPINSVEKIYQDHIYLIHKVLPTIFEKWLVGDKNITITIQQDNTMTHIDPNDKKFRLDVSIWFERLIKMSTSQLSRL